jgi:toxin ParE1/3/4
VGEAHEIVWSPNAIRDIDDVLEFVADARSADEAERLYLKIVSRVESLSRFPRRARLVPELRRIGVQEYRELVIPSYRVFFRITGRAVAILGVFDSRRDLSELLLRRALEPLPFEEPEG